MSPRQISNELYESLSSTIREELRAFEEETNVRAGTKLISQGVPAEHIIIINLGSVEISTHNGAHVISIDVAGAGKVLGLRSIVGDVLPEINVIALEDCAITLIPKLGFLKVLERNPQMYFAIAKVLSADLKMAENLLRQAPGSRSLNLDT